MKTTQEQLSVWKGFILILLLLGGSFTSNAQEESDPFIKEIYFTNSAGEKISGAVSLDEKVVFLNIETARAIGEKVKITMDEDEEYFYKKKFLAGGSSFHFLIKEDSQKIKLVLYNPSKKKHVKRRMEATGEEPAEDATGD